MTTQSDVFSASPGCWTVQPVAAEDAGAEGRLRRRLLELLHAGFRRILLDLTACGQVPIGRLHVLGELVSWFDTAYDGDAVDIRALAPGEDLRRLLRDAGVAPPVPVVTRLAEAVDPDGVLRRDPGPRAPGASEQAVFLTYAVSWPHGTGHERALLLDLADELAAAVAPGRGELDGFDVIGEQAVFFLYGPDCTTLWECARPHARRDAPPLVGVELRFGGLCAPHVHLAWDSRAARICG